MVKLRLTDPAPQVTVACAVPGSVLGPISQVQVAFPALLARVDPRPRDWLTEPLGKTTRNEQVSFAVREWALSESSAPRAIDASNEVIATAPPDDAEGGVDVGEVSAVPAA